MNKAPYNRRSIHRDVSHLPLDQIQYAITPPLLEEEIVHCKKSDEKNLTNYAGKVCEDLVKSYCAENRWNVAEPEIDMGIDLLINRSNRWDKVQVKKVVFWETDYGLMTQKFQFQSGGISKDVRLRHRQSSPDDFDSFIHVLSTPYRQLIFETPVDQIPLKKDGTFIQSRGTVITQNYKKAPKGYVDWGQNMVRCLYHPKLFLTFPEFWNTRDNNLSTLLS